MKKITAIALAAAMTFSLTACRKSAQRNISTLDKGTVVWENKLVSVTYRSIDNSDPCNPIVKLKVRNKTGEQVVFRSDSLYENDHKMLPVGYTLLDPDDTSELAVYAMTMDEAADVGEVGRISLWLSAAGSKTSATSKEIVITSPNADQQEETPAHEGEELCNVDGVQLTAVHSGGKWYMHITNATRFDQGVRLDSIRVNGVETKAEDSGTVFVHSGKRAMQAIDIPDTGKIELRFELIKHSGEMSVSEFTDFIPVEGIS